MNEAKEELPLLIFTYSPFGGLLAGIFGAVRSGIFISAQSRAPGCVPCGERPGPAAAVAGFQRGAGKDGLRSADEPGISCEG